MEVMMMNIGDIVEYKELMAIAKEQGNKDEFKKIYNLFISAYNNYIGKNFDEEMKKKL